jgi:multidrug transporter EmrE-like cation transporter
VAVRVHAGWRWPAASACSASRCAHLPLGTAYAVWTGIGTIGTAVFGMMMLGEPAGALRMLSIGLIAAGIAGLKLLTPA